MARNDDAENVTTQGGAAAMQQLEPGKVLVPYTGEVIDLTPVGAAERLVEAEEYRRALRSFEDACRDVLRAESDRLGKRTFEQGGRKIEVDTAAAAMEKVYDANRLWDELLEAGCPVERLGELVTLEPKVSGTVIRQLRQNPAYSEIIDACVIGEKPRARRVKVSS